jgi:hypothetical protein
MIKYKLHGLMQQMPLAHEGANETISVAMGRTFMNPNVSESGVYNLCKIRLVI